MAIAHGPIPLLSRWGLSTPTALAEEVTKGKAKANKVNPNLLNFFMFLRFKVKHKI
jgi:hypothetical protein